MPRQRSFMTVLLFAVAGVVALYLALLALLWWGQERLLFLPTVLPAEHRFGHAADVHETWVEVPGARLNALHLRRPQPDGVVFFLHGNAGSLQTWFTGGDFYRQTNMDLFIFDYRGYGKSSGRIDSQAQLEADVRAAWQQVAAHYATRIGQPGFKRVIFGRSLGSGLAASLAADLQPELTVLVSPYRSMVQVATEQYPFVPAALLRYPLRTEAWLARVKTPILLAHGGKDTLIPPRHGQALKALVPHAEWLLVPEAGHGDIHEFPAYLDGLAAAIKR
jgi:uncharacterized protein